ncbi:NAD(P)H:quinone oxidoreductase, type IV [Neoconidiobolus thromboides FSU 785]|nr:NAD(P)H:quinone oxidoreductase, type IV [Neoconidiobolus thromboides FSU 785]
MSRLTKIHIPYYSFYGHIHKLAKALKTGAEKVPGVQATLFQIPETVPKEILERIKAPAKPADVSVITAENLKEADGFLFGMPTRFGTLPAQQKNFWDQLGGLWASNALHGKFAGTFVASNTQHGGQESTHLTFIPTLVHFGMIYVPLGYASKHLNEELEVIGGSPYGASAVVGNSGKVEVHPKELEIAEIQGENFAKVVSQYVNGAKSN